MPASSTRSDHISTRGCPNRRLRSCASGENSAQATSGTAASTPSADTDMPVSAPIWSSSGPRPVIAGRMFAATRQTATSSMPTDAARDGSGGTVRDDEAIGLGL